MGESAVLTVQGERTRLSLAADCAMTSAPGPKTRLLLTPPPAPATSMSLRKRRLAKASGETVAGEPPTFS